MTETKSSAKLTAHQPTGLLGVALNAVTTTFFITAAAGCFLSLMLGIRSLQQHSTTAALKQIEIFLTIHSWIAPPHWVNTVLSFYRKSCAVALQQSNACFNDLTSLSSNLPAFQPNNQNPFAHQFSQNCSEFKAQVLPLISGAAAVMVLRLWIFITALPLLLISLSIGLVDGLVQRNIRKYQGARESALLFHRIKRSGAVIIYLPLLAYFAWLSPISPLWFLMPMAIAAGFWLAFSLRYFKKYV